LVGRVAGIAVNNNKAAHRQLKELKRHNDRSRNLSRIIHQSEQKITTRKKNVTETLKVPKDVTINV